MKDYEKDLIQRRQRTLHRATGRRDGDADRDLPARRFQALEGHGQVIEAGLNFPVARPARPRSTPVVRGPPASDEKTQLRRPLAGRERGFPPPRVSRSVRLPLQQS